MNAPIDPKTTAFGPLIQAYSRAEAIADGVLIDVSAVAREAGIRVPVAMTAAAWADCVAWSAEDSTRQTPQDEAGRLWDVVWMAALMAQRGSGLFQLSRVPRGGRGTRPRLTALRLHIGPGDVGEPVVTLLMPDED